MAKSLLKKKCSSISTPRNSRNVNLSAFPIYSLHRAYQHICYPCTKISLKRMSQTSLVTWAHIVSGPEPCSPMLGHCVVYHSIRLCLKGGSGCVLALTLLGVSQTQAWLPQLLLHLPRRAEEEAAQTDRIPIPLHSPSESLSGRLSTALAACSHPKTQ